MSAANLSIPVAMAAVIPLATRPEKPGPQAVLQQPSHFMKLIESLIGGEVAPLSPTQLPGQEKSVVLSLKGQAVNIGEIKDATKGRKTSKDSGQPRDPKDEQRGGLLAMMVAVPVVRTKPALSLSIGRAASDDSFVKSSKSAGDNNAHYAPPAHEAAPQAAAAPRPAESRVQPPTIDQSQTRGTVQDQSRNEVKHPETQEVTAQPGTPAAGTTAVSAPVQTASTAAIQVPASTPTPALTSTPAQIGIPLALPMQKPTSSDAPAKDRQSAADRPRPKIDLSPESRQSPALPPALGKVRAEGPASTEPIAFAARLTEREEPEETQNATPSVVQRGEKQPGLTQSPQAPAVLGKEDAENVPTNPKSNSQATASPISSESAASKPKAVAVERVAENVPTNPKSPAAFAMPEREASSRGPQNSPKSTTAPEVKASALMQETELQAKPTIRSEPAREISIRIPSADHGNVDVQIVERDGKVQVTVRGSDTQLNSALRGELTELVHTLDQKGYKTETWTPSETNPLTSASSPEVKTPGRNEASQDWSGNEPNGGGNGGNAGGNQQQRRQQQERPDWLIELERRLDTEG